MAYTKCTVEGCEKADRPGRQYCGMHAARLRIHGDLHYSYKSLEERIKRFWADVDKSSGYGPWGDCWQWTGRLDRDGYGACKSRAPGSGSAWRAHRFAFTLTRGDIPTGFLVRHRCDVRNCVNPDHLELGTNQDNMADREARGRTAKGEQMALAKLTDADVRVIKVRLRAGEKQAPMAREYGVSEGVINHISSNRNWTHIQI